MLEEGAGRVGTILAAIEDGGEGRHATWLAKAVQHARAIVITKVGASGRVGAIDGRLRTLQASLDSKKGNESSKESDLGRGRAPRMVLVSSPCMTKVVDQEIKSILESTSIVTSEAEV